MKITDTIKNKKHTLSFEVFPPKESANYEKLAKVAVDIASLKPAFVSVTYGAGGGTSEYTLSIAKEIKEKTGTEAITHLTCINSNKEEIGMRLKNLKASGIENIMALRGDIAEDRLGLDRNLLDYKHATDLISEIKNSGYDFCLGAACYPEKHPESVSLEEDILNLKKKVDLGVDFLTTQLFFDNSLFYSFLDKLDGIDVPVFPGIMPITKAIQIEKVCKLSGANIPKEFVDNVEKYASCKEAMEEAGINYATNQILDLYSHGITNVHVYTMNNYSVAEKILKNVSNVLG